LSIGLSLEWILFRGRRVGDNIIVDFARQDQEKNILRTQADLVYDHLFNDLLKDGRWTVRFSVGPCFNFGKNIG
jgi:hypothetical protein